MMGTRPAPPELPVLQAPHSHLYPGLVGRLVVEPGMLEALPRDGVERCMIEFADGASAFGRLEGRRSTAQLLCVDGYRTRRGTEIPPKRWEVTLSKGEGAAAAGTRFRITRRLPQDAAEPD